MLQMRSSNWYFQLQSCSQRHVNVEYVHTRSPMCVLELHMAAAKHSIYRVSVYGQITLYCPYTGADNSVLPIQGADNSVLPIHAPPPRDHGMY